MHSCEGLCARYTTSPHYKNKPKAGFIPLTYNTQPNS